MAGPNVTDLVYRWFADTRQFERGTRQAQGTLNGVAATAAKVAGAVGIAFGVDQLRQFAQEAFNLGAAAEEVDSKFQAVFGSAEDLNQALADWGDMAGVTTTQAKDMAATFGNLAQAQGFSLDQSKEMSLQVAQLAGDMASFNDVDPATVFNDLNKALLTTEREGMKKYGIAVSEAEVKTKAMAIAMSDGRTEITQQDRALASMEIVTRQAGKALGDLERTQDSTANQARQLKATVKELQEGIGRALVPEIRMWIKAGNDLSFIMRSLNGTLQDSGLVMAEFSQQAGIVTDILNPVGKAAEYVTDVIGEVADHFRDAEVSFKEFGDTSQVIADHTLAHLGAQIREVTAAQQANREEIEQQFTPLQSYASTLDGIIAKYRIMQGLQPDWGDFGPTNPYLGPGGSFNPYGTRDSNTYADRVDPQ